jgi:hypothetical protein
VIGRSVEARSVSQELPLLAAFSLTWIFQFGIGNLLHKTDCSGLRTVLTLYLLRRAGASAQSFLTIYTV